MDNIMKEGILSKDLPNKLRQTIFFLVGVHFSLQGLKEQRDLHR